MVRRWMHPDRIVARWRVACTPRNPRAEVPKHDEGGNDAKGGAVRDIQFAPTGQWHPAQGTAKRYPGNKHRNLDQPQRGCGTRQRDRGRNPVGVENPLYARPKVARAAEPWAEGPNPVGIQVA